MAESIKIGKRTVDALKPSGIRYVAWDTDLPGFGIRVGTTGGKTYVLKYRVGGGRAGRVRWGVIGQHGALTPDQAREVAQRWAAEVAAGGDPAGEKIVKRKSLTVAELMGEYLKSHVKVRNKPSTVAYVSDLVQRIICKDPLAKLKVSDVAEADIARFHARLASKPTTANRARAALSKAFTLAETWGYREKHSNPCGEVEKYRETPRERFLSPAEFAALGEALGAADRAELVLIEDGKVKPVRVSKWAVAAIRLLIFTGARRGEILGLRWEWIDWQAGRANLPDSKTGRKPLMLPPAALEVLEGLERPDSGKGFVIRGGDYSDPEVPLVNLKDPWGIIRKAAGLADVRPHDLRHSFASVMVAGGASLPVIGALLGHRDVKTTARYAHLATDPLRVAADQVGGVLASHLKGPEGGAEVVPLHRKR
ncbi:site-specific integrase [Tabrizicola soli]|uniref:Tyrosine-type recombinase/integrase n=1 Tax=Tabrizicola soli TaxID=2185115 RepID=A0ABV7DVC3_9RHOB|nr:site-specific integrase [Tabrizicola soli]